MIGNRKNKNTGFVLLYAMIVVSITLSIGLAIFSISQKELILSSTVRESNFAFFASDAGTECALFWDIRYRDDLNPDITSAFDPNSKQTIRCAGIDIPDMGGAAVSRFTIDFSLAPAPSTNRGCVEVVVTKDNSGGTMKTTIESNGYNTCNVLDQQRVQRTIAVKY